MPQARLSQKHARALELTEQGYNPVIYFPRDDIAMAFLDQTEKTSHCPHKGNASYFSIITKNGPIENVAWSYEAPQEALAQNQGTFGILPE